MINDYNLHSSTRDQWIQSSCAFVIYYIGPSYLPGIKNYGVMYLTRWDRLDLLPKKDAHSIRPEYIHWMSSTVMLKTAFFLFYVIYLECSKVASQSWLNM
jgi:hypothetical protein